VGTPRAITIQLVLCIFLGVRAVEGMEKKAVLWLRGANVEVEVAFEGDVVTVLLGVHYGGASSDEASVLIVGEGFEVSYSLVEVARSEARFEDEAHVRLVGSISACPGRGVFTPFGGGPVGERDGPGVLDVLDEPAGWVGYSGLMGKSVEVAAAVPRAVIGD
jgi:hypothetical protein